MSEYQEQSSPASAFGEVPLSKDQDEFGLPLFVIPYLRSVSVVDNGSVAKGFGYDLDTQEGREAYLLKMRELINAQALSVWLNYTEERGERRHKIISINRIGPKPNND